jgi:hypothetical protein
VLLRLRERPASFDERALANLAWTFARLANARLGGVLELTAPLEQARAPPANPPAARPRTRGADAAAGGQVLRELEGRDRALMPPQALCNVAWAAAKADVSRGVALRALDAALDQASAAPAGCAAARSSARSPGAAAHAGSQRTGRVRWMVSAGPLEPALGVRNAAARAPWAAPRRRGAGAQPRPRALLVPGAVQLCVGGRAGVHGRRWGRCARWRGGRGGRGGAVRGGWGGGCGAGAARLPLAGGPPPPPLPLY